MRFRPLTSTSRGNGVSRSVAGTMANTAESVVGGVRDPYGATMELACNYDEGTVEASRIELALQAGEPFVGVVGGKAGTPSGSPMISGFRRLEVSP